MTYTEYVNQVDPVYNPCVILTKEDCNVKDCGIRSDGKQVYEVTISYNGSVFHYQVIPFEGNLLRVIKESGSIGGISVFHLDMDDFPIFENVGKYSVFIKN